MFLSIRFYIFVFMYLAMFLTRPIMQALATAEDNRFPFTIGNIIVVYNDTVATRTTAELIVHLLHYCMHAFNRWRINHQMASIRSIHQYLQEIIVCILTLQGSKDRHLCIFDELIRGEVSSCKDVVYPATRNLL